MSADLVTDCLARLDEAHQNGVITDHSVETMRSWLREPRYAEFAEQLADLIVRAKADQEIWKSLDDAYWTVIPFGTGGRRGKMFPVGSNAINDRTIGKVPKGLLSMSWQPVRKEVNQVVRSRMTPDIVQNILPSCVVKFF